MFEDVPVGAELAVAAAAVDPADLPDGALLDWVAAWQQVISHATARLSAGIVELAHRRLDPPFDPAGRSLRVEGVNEFAVDELAVALCWTRVAAGTALGFALDLDAAPGVRAALAAGVIDPPRARVLTDAVRDLSPAQVAAVETAVLPRAGGWTTGQTRAEVGRALAQVVPDALEARRDRAVRARRVLHTPRPETGTGVISAELAAVDALAVWSTLDRVARAGRAGDPRGMDARRADALVALVTGRPALPAPRPADHPHDAAAGDGAGTSVAGGVPEHAAGAGARTVPQPPRVPPGAGIALTITVGTWAGTSDDPGYLPGYGHITATHARELLTHATTSPEGRRAGRTRVALTDPHTGVLRALSQPILGIPDPPDPDDLADDRPPDPGAGPDDRPPDPDDRPPESPPDHGFSGAGPPAPGPGLDPSPGGALADSSPRRTPQARPAAAGITATPPRRSPDPARAGTPGWATGPQHPGDATLEAPGVLAIRWTYRPTPAQEAFVRARDRSCQFPGCRVPARACDVDHVTAHPAGATIVENLICLCRTHHRLKHTGRWHVHRRPDGTLAWTTPTGVVLHRRPPAADTASASSPRRLAPAHPRQRRRRPHVRET